MVAVDFLAGLLGGAASVFVSYPFDTVKVRLQTQSMLNAKYTGILNCFASIIKQESVFGLYKGITIPLVSIALINAITFNIYASIFKKLTPDNEQKKIINYFYAGAVAGLVQSFISSPFELVKLRLQLQGQGVRHRFRQMAFYFDNDLHYKGPMDCLKKVYIKEGYKGVMRGTTLTVIRDIPGFGLYFASYEYFARKISHDGPVHYVLMQQLLVGGIAGMLSWSMYPVDVMKSRFQADDAGKYRNTWDCVVKCYNQDGIKAFGQGVSSTMVRAFAVNAITFFTVEWTYRLAHKYLKKNSKGKKFTDEDDDHEHFQSHFFAH